MNIPPTILPAMLVVALAACATPAVTDASLNLSQGIAEPASSTANAQQVFFDRITALCGQSFAGNVLVDRPGSTGPNAFRDQPLTMHVRECSEQEIRIPFHVGADRSRTWVLTRAGDGLRLKHDHRQENGSDDPVTMYGGDTADNGSAGRQEFPVDGFSKSMFTREGMTVSNTNVWAIEIEPGQRFVYELARTDQDRLFRVGFDLTRPIATPPAPWGASDAIPEED
ncbi:MAG: hypothetical protein ACOH1L_06955 [Thermomonas sp.]